MMKLKELIEKLQRLAKESPEALEMQVFHLPYTDDLIVDVGLGKELERNKVFLIGNVPF
jgi:hypothetical protein